MILDTIDNFPKYERLNPHFLAAFSFLKNTDLSALPAGKHDILGEKVFARMLEREHLGKDKFIMESHRKYIDLHYTIEGVDVAGWRPLQESTPKGPYIEQSDDFLFDDKPRAWFDILPGHFVLFFPQDVHVAMAGEGRIRKVVVKIAVE